MRHAVAAGAGILIAAAIGAGPASANVYCVDVTDPACTNPMGSDAVAAFAAATTHGGADEIRLGPATYAATSLTSFDDNGQELHVRGSGRGSTILVPQDSPSFQSYLNLQNANSSVADLTIRGFPGTNSIVDSALRLAGGDAARVAVDAPASSGLTGVDVSGADASFVDGSVTVPKTGGTTGVFSRGDTVVSNATIAADNGLVESNPSGATLRGDRLDLEVGRKGAQTDGGSIQLSNSLIHLDPAASNGVGLQALNNNSSGAPKSIAATGVTIVGGGGGSIGALVRSDVPATSQVSIISLTNSIIDGFETSLSATAANNGGALAPSVASIVTDHSNYDPATAASAIGPGGSGGISAASQTNLAPGFASPSTDDFRLTPGSALVDIGDSAKASGIDLDGHPRIADGNRDGSAVADLGAYELATPADTTPPETTIVKAPKKKSAKRRAKLTFTSSEAGSSFECKLDRKGFKPCSSPLRLKRLKRAKHVFLVRAIDPAGNPDPSPAQAKFKVKKKR
jgi:hypothetical protein